MNVKVTRITQDWLMNMAFSATVGKGVQINKAKALRSEHSPIRCLWYWIEFEDVPQRVVNHLTRHKIGVEWFVETSRPDRVKEQPDTRNMSCLINAQALITISRTRLCNKAWHETRDAWKLVKKEMEYADESMAEAMVPNCVYRGKCPEIQSCEK